MKPAPFNYISAKTVDEAIAALARPNAKLLAGGQSLVPMMNFRLVRPEWLIDINRLSELKGIDLTEGSVHIGSMVRYSEIGNSNTIREAVPMITEVIPLIAHTAIRNRGTIGGSVSHADPAADMPVALMALDAVMHTRSSRGDRAITCEKFFVSLFTTALADDELLVRVRVPVIGSNEGWAFEEFSRRKGDFALASVAVRLRVVSGKIEGPVRIALGAAADHVVRAHQAEARLMGGVPAPELFQAAAEMASREIEPMTDIHGSSEYRRNLVRGLVRSALERAASRAVERQLAPPLNTGDDASGD